MDIAKYGLDKFSYNCGFIDGFNEIVHAGVKRIALSPPFDTVAERDTYEAFCKECCESWQTHYYMEDGILVTDLFPVDAGPVILFYQDPKDLEEYLALKEEKARLEAEGTLDKPARTRIARAFGKLLSYTDEAIEAMLA